MVIDELVSMAILSVTMVAFDNVFGPIVDVDAVDDVFGPIVDAVVDVAFFGPIVGDIVFGLVDLIVDLIETMFGGEVSAMY